MNKQTAVQARIGQGPTPQKVIGVVPHTSGKGLPATVIATIDEHAGSAHYPSPLQNQDYLSISRDPGPVPTPCRGLRVGKYKKMQRVWRLATIPSRQLQNPHYETIDKSKSQNCILRTQPSVLLIVHRRANLEGKFCSIAIAAPFPFPLYQLLG